MLRSLARTEDADELNRLIEAGHVDRAVDLLRIMVREETSLIYIVRGKDEGRPAWHLVKVRSPFEVGVFQAGPVNQIARRQRVRRDSALGMG